MTHFKTMVTNGNFLAPTCSQDLSFLSAFNHSSTFIPCIFFRPADERNRFANALKARRVFVSLTLEAE
jgi:hypothetical protein